LGDALDWTWFEATCGSTAIGTGTSINVSPSQTTTYLATGTGGCVVGAPCQAINITVNPLPPQPTITSSGSNYLCFGDTVKLGITPSIAPRFADSVIVFSSEITNTDWAAAQIIGQPNTYPAYGDFMSTWSSATPDNQREYIELGFSNPAPINFVKLYETYNPGAVDTVYIFNPNTVAWDIVYAVTAEAQIPTARIFTIDFPLTPYPVSKIRLALNSPAVSGYNQIDAVSIGYEVNSTTWNPVNLNQPSINVGSSGSYTVTIVDNNGCTATSTPYVTTTDVTPPTITCANDTSICLQPGQVELCGASFVPLPTISIPKTIVYVDRYITYTNVSLNGGGNAALVAPNSTVSLSFDMSVAFDYQNGYCPGCVVQSYIGLGDSPNTIVCFGSIGDGFSSPASATFVAPSTPGIYYLTQNGTLHYFCQPMNYSNYIADAIAVIRVGFGDILQATDDCGDVEITNNAPNCLQVGTTAITWTATDLSGNTATCIQNVTINPAPTITASNDTTVCAGNPIQLTANGANFYSWSESSNLNFASQLP
jgi:hypothetical protein